MRIGRISKLSSSTGLLETIVLFLNEPIKPIFLMIDIKLTLSE